MACTENKFSRIDLTCIIRVCVSVCTVDMLYVFHGMCVCTSLLYMYMSVCIYCAQDSISVTMRM